MPSQEKLTSVMAAAACCCETVSASPFGAGARHYTRIENLVAALEQALAPDATLLVKGSRFMRMERVVAALAGQPADGGH